MPKFDSVFSLKGYVLMVLLFGAIGCASQPIQKSMSLSDKSLAAPVGVPHFSSLNELVSWSAAEFKYDSQRLYDTTVAQGESKKSFVVRDPELFYSLKRGICTDFAHFGVQVARRDQLSQSAQYLKLYLKPRKVRGHIVSRHWLAIAKSKSGKLQFFADSRNPGRLTPEYESVKDFLQNDTRYQMVNVESFEVREQWDLPTQKIAFLRERLN